MPQDLAQLKAQFTHVQELARRGTWQPPPPSPVEVRLTTVDSPGDVGFDALVPFVRSVKQRTGLDLILAGGGFGCFDLGFTADGPGGDALDAAITNDPEVQHSLNSLNTHAVRVRTHEIVRSYRAFYDISIAVATNRKPQDSTSDLEEGVRGIFGEAARKETSYGLAQVSVSDLSQGQPKETLLKRVWRYATLGLGDLRERRDKIIVRQFEQLDRDSFSALLKSPTIHGAVVMVHGYANSFDDAINACARDAYGARLDRLELLPMVFSWPSRDSMFKYIQDTKSAENSEFRLLEVLDLVTAALGDTRVDVLAHSYGNKLLVRSLTTKVKGRVDRTRWLKRLVLVEPDVDQDFITERAELLVDASDRIVLYHSENDRALWAASRLFDSVRAGQKGIPTEDLDRKTAERLEIIDASSVAQGWSRHAPHLESAEVIDDLYYLFKGLGPSERHNLHPVSPAHWKIVPTLHQ